MLYKEIVISTSHLLCQFQVSEHIICMDSYSANSLVKNPKHITAIAFSSKSNNYPFASQTNSYECYSSASQMPDYLLVICCSPACCLATSCSVTFCLVTFCSVVCCSAAHCLVSAARCLVACCSAARCLVSVAHYSVAQRHVAQWHVVQQHVAQ